ncbi:hypothetical protein Tco_0006446 [Tanacetum coccineum]
MDNHSPPPPLSFPPKKRLCHVGNPNPHKNQSMVESNRLGFQEKPRDRMCIDFTLSQQAHPILVSTKKHKRKKTRRKDRVVFHYKKDCKAIVATRRDECVHEIREQSMETDVIVNGDLKEESAPTGETSAPPAPKTAKQLVAKRNQERVKSILLLAIPDEYLLKFHNVADAKSLWAAIKARFGGNEESKKMQKNVLKHQFENFTTASNESLDKAYDSIPPSWNQIALIMRNKPDIDEIDIDDHYNNLRVYEDKMKRYSSSTSTSQNLAFLSSENASSTNEVSTASGDFGVSTFFAQPTTSPQLENEDFYATTVTEKGTLLGNADLEGIKEEDLMSNDFEVEPVNYALMAISSSSSSSSFDNEGNPRSCYMIMPMEDSGSSHMIGNIAYLSDYEFTLGFGAFRYDPIRSLFRVKSSRTGFSSALGIANFIELASPIPIWNCTTEEGLQAISATIDGHEKLITEASLRRHLKLEDAEGISSLSNEEIFEQLAYMGYVTNSESLTFFKGHFSPQWKFFIHTILHCLSSKKTAWDQFSSNIVTAIICLATSRRFNFSKFIFEAMVKNLDSSHKSLLYPRFIQLLLNKQQRLLLPHTRTYPTPTLTKETASMPHDSPLHVVHSHRSAEGSMQQLDLTVLVNKLNDRIDGLEKDLQQTKKIYSTALTKLVLRVKKLKYKLKSGKARKKAKIVLSDDEEIAKDSSKQWRKISQIDEDPTISLVQDEEETPTEIIEEHGSGEKGKMEISTASPPKVTKVSTAEAHVYTRKKAKDKGKAIMEEPATPKKVKKRTQV